MKIPTALYIIPNSVSGNYYRYELVKYILLNTVWYQTNDWFSIVSLGVLWPITVAARSMAWNIFARRNIGIVGSNLTQSMDICLRLCIVLCR
jgi:hypothetical protein